MGISAISVWLLQWWGLIKISVFFEYFVVYFITFLVFRLFDIFKPLGISWLETVLNDIAEEEAYGLVKTGDKLSAEYNLWYSLAIMFDDALAGVYTALISFPIIWLVINKLYN